MKILPYNRAFNQNFPPPLGGEARHGGMPWVRERGKSRIRNYYRKLSLRSKDLFFNMAAVDIPQIKKNLKTSRFGQTIHFEPSVDSTNRRALSGIDSGAKCGEVFLTDYKTKGHGRGNRLWESAEGKNILMPLIDFAPASAGKIFQ